MNLHHELPGLDDDDYAEVAAMFLEQGRGAMREIVDAANAGERERAASAAHRLRGSALAFGAEELADALRRIEAARSAEDPGLAAAAARARELFTAVDEELSAILRGRRA
jgi:HPt (histidine-containing phosphotransfer) domain-containing protein